MVAGLGRDDVVGHQQADRPEQLRPGVDQRLGKLPRRFRQAAMPALQPGEHRLGGILQRLTPLGKILAGDRLRLEGRVVAGAFGQRAMHLRRAQPELSRQRQEEIVGVGHIGGAIRRCRARRRLVQRVVEIAGQIIERQAPAVALIAHKAVQHAGRAGVVVGLARQGQLERRQGRRRVGETGALGQEAAHLDLGMRAGLQPPVQLQDRVVLVQHRAVRLLGAEPPRYHPFRRRRRGEQRRMPETQLARGVAAIAQWQIRLALDRLEQRQAEIVQHQRVDQRAFAARLTQLGQARRQQVLALLAAGRSPYRRERQHIDLRLVAGQLRLHDLDQEAFRRTAAGFRHRRGELAIGQHPGRLEFAILGRKPALPRQKARDHVAFELRQIVPAEQIGPAMRHHQCGSEGVGGSSNQKKL